jgi:glycosyltransferase involved in cell wall biosynthesis
MNPLVSVIIPTYNRREFVQEAIESVLRQDFDEREVIVIDDGSTDGTEAALRRFPSIHYYSQTNQGVSLARNQGLQLAQGALICFLDSDDLWLPKKLSTQVRLMAQHPDVLVSYTDEIWIRRGRRVNPKKKHQKHSGWVFAQCLPLCSISPSSVMLRREVFDQVGCFDESLPVCEDYDLWLRIAARFPVTFIAEKLIIKRGGHDDQLSHRFWGNDRFRVQALIKLLKEVPLDDGQQRAAMTELLAKCAILEQGFRKREKFEEAAYYHRLKEEYQKRLAYLVTKEVG